MGRSGKILNWDLFYTREEKRREEICIGELKRRGEEDLREEERLVIVFVLVWLETSGSLWTQLALRLHLTLHRYIYYPYLTLSLLLNSTHHGGHSWNLTSTPYTDVPRLRFPSFSSFQFSLTHNGPLRSEPATCHGPTLCKYNS